VIAAALVSAKPAVDADKSLPSARDQWASMFFYRRVISIDGISATDPDSGAGG
jgi:hypothetical protein